MSKETKHTPAPWHVWRLADDEKTYGKNAGKNIIVANNDETEVCGVIENPKDARLIAASPAMFNAIHLAHRELREFYSPKDSEALRVLEDIIKELSA